MRQSRVLQLAKLGKKLTVIKLSDTPNKEAAYKRTMFYELKSMGGVFFKALQVMSVTYRFLEGWAGPKEMTVFNRIPTEEIDIDNYIKNKSVFRSYERTPFATGSFAQVYKGVLSSGETVAIKVLRPSIARNLKGDLKYLKRVAQLFAGFLPSTILDYQKVVGEFCANCSLETDYLREIENMKYFQTFYKDHPYVVVPKVYAELSGSDVIVQEFIGGPTFADVLVEHTPFRPATKIANELTGSNLWTQMIIAGGEALRMAMQADYIFGDPHPGNIKLLPGDKIAFIDYGIIANKPTSQWAFYEWVKAYHATLTGKGGLDALATASLNCFASDIAIALNTCELNDASPALDTITEALASKFDNMKNDKIAKELAGNGHFFKLFTESLDGKNALNIKLDTANFQLIKAMQSYLGSLTVLDNSETRDRFAFAMQSAMNYALRYADIYGVKNDMPLRSRFNTNESYELLVDTVSSLAEGDQFIFKYINDRMTV
ncbi:MAG: AarF/ABC1/UbiB kinase family protein [Candidatus Nomurabacteria bacterium]|jgi:hypothetical protein|nr:AarF/ABC1/UbiB kinase family protein [Candidatus Nomurabacteria bacterium]